MSPAKVSTRGRRAIIESSSLTGAEAQAHRSNPINGKREKKEQYVRLRSLTPMSIH